MLTLLNPRDPEQPFPDPSEAELEPNGLLAVGGDLSVPRLLSAYRAGIFPWYSTGQPILWWSPDPRTLLFPERLRVSRSLRKTLVKGRFLATIDRDFDGVIAACAAPRGDQAGTWILPEMMRAYRRLHRLGLAHSVEVWAAGALVGGLYGVALGRVFFGESMFSRQSDASKAALVHLCHRLHQWGYRLIDCQLETDHLLRLGAEPVPRAAFRALLDLACAESPAEESWQQSDPEDPGQVLRERVP
jgi:leucyl/phenylalanyl-tRNA--protein transferase